MRSAVFSLLLLYWSASASFSQVTFLHTDEIEKQFHFSAKNPHIFWFSSPLDLPVDTVFKKLDKDFIPLNSFALNKGPSNQLHWIAVPFENNGSLEESIFFTLKNSAINRIEYYWIVDRRIEVEGVTGDDFPFTHRPYGFCNFTFPISIRPNQKGILLLELDKRNENFFCGFSVLKEREFHRFEIFSYWMFGIFSGIILVTIAVNLFLFFSLRDWVHLWYGFYAITNLLLLLSYDGLDFQFLYPNMPFLSNVSRYLTSGFAYILLFQLLIVFVKQGNITRFVGFVTRGFQLVHFSIILLALCTHLFFADSIWLKIFLFRSLSIVGGLSLICLFLFSFQSYRRGNQQSLLFVVAMAILFLGSVEYIVNINGWYTGLFLFESVIPSNLQICVILEVLMVFFAIFYRHKKYRLEGLVLKNKLLESESRWREQELILLNEERKRIAMDMHDELGSRLFGAKMKIESICMKEANSALKEVGEELNIISKQIKNIIWSLSDDRIGVSAQFELLRSRMEELFKHSPISFYFSLNSELESVPHALMMDVQLIILEIASNTLKYSSCSKVQLDVYLKNSEIEIDWSELPYKKSSSAGQGIGLLSIQKRIEKWKGTRVPSEHRFRYHVIFPLPRPNQ